MKMFLFIIPFCPFIIGIIAFEVVLCMALMKVASLDDRHNEAMWAEWRRQKGAGTIGS